MPDGMTVGHTQAQVSIEVRLYGTLPLLKTHRGETMGVQVLNLLYRSEDARPWGTMWQAVGYDNETGHALMDVVSQAILRRDWPGWIVDIVESNRPKTGDRTTLPEL